MQTNRGKGNKKEKKSSRPMFSVYDHRGITLRNLRTSPLLIWLAYRTDIKVKIDVSRIAPKIHGMRAHRLAYPGHTCTDSAQELNSRLITNIINTENHPRERAVCVFFFRAIVLVAHIGAPSVNNRPVNDVSTIDRILRYFSLSSFSRDRRSFIDSRVYRSRRHLLCPWSTCNGKDTK